MQSTTPKTIFIQNRRKDGRFAVVAEYPNGTRKTDVMTAEQLRASQISTAIVGGSF